MKALTLTQPWASLVAIGAKRIETRSWATSYRGPLVIHAAKGFPKDCRELCFEEPFFESLSGEYRRHEPHLLPVGAIVAVCELRDCLSTRLAVEGIRGDQRELAFGNFGPNRFAWFLSDVRYLAEPIPCRGHLGLWVAPEEVLAQLPQRQAPRRDEAVEDLAALPSSGSGNLSALGFAVGAVALELGANEAAGGTGNQDIHTLSLPQLGRQPRRRLSQSRYKAVNGTAS